MVSAAAFQARVRGFVSQSRRFERNKMFLPHPLVRLSIVRSLHVREVSCSPSDFQGLHFESCVWRAVSSHSSHHPQEVLLAWFEPGHVPLKGQPGTHVLLTRQSDALPMRHAPSLPGRNETLNQRLLNVGPSSTTLAQHQANVGSMSRPPLL